MLRNVTETIHKMYGSCNLIFLSGTVLSTYLRSETLYLKFHPMQLCDVEEDMTLFLPEGLQ